MSSKFEMKHAEQTSTVIYYDTRRCLKWEATQALDFTCQQRIGQKQGEARKGELQNVLVVAHALTPTSVEYRRQNQGKGPDMRRRLSLSVCLSVCLSPILLVSRKHSTYFTRTPRQDNGSQIYKPCDVCGRINANAR